MRKWNDLTVFLQDLNFGSYKNYIRISDGITTIIYTITVITPLSLDGCLANTQHPSTSSKSPPMGKQWSTLALIYHRHSCMQISVSTALKFKYIVVITAGSDPTYSYPLAWYRTRSGRDQYPGAGSITLRLTAIPRVHRRYGLRVQQSILSVDKAVLYMSCKYEWVLMKSMFHPSPWMKVLNI